MLISFLQTTNNNMIKVILAIYITLNNIRLCVINNLSFYLMIKNKFIDYCYLIFWINTSVTHLAQHLMYCIGIIKNAGSLSINADWLCHALNIMQENKMCVCKKASKIFMVFWILGRILIKHRQFQGMSHHAITSNLKLKY